MKKLVVLLLTMLSIESFADTFSGLDKNGNTCSLKVISQDQNSLTVKIAGERLNKKMKLEYDHSTNSYQMENRSDYGSIDGIDIGRAETLEVNLTEGYFRYYRSAFLLVKYLEVYCELK